MKAIVLLAGRSRRFSPLKEKALFGIMGKPLLVHQIARLTQAGFTDITLVGGAHNKKEIDTLFPSMHFVEQKDLDLGMQGALLDALPAMGKEPVLIVSSNDVVDVSAYEDVRKQYEKRKGSGVILAKRVTNYFPGGYLSVDKESRITGIVEKPGAGSEPSDLVTIVVHAHPDASVLLNALQNTKSMNDDGYERALTSLFLSQSYHALPYEGVWHPVKYPWHLLSVSEHLLQKIDESSIASPELVHPTAVIQGKVILGKGVKVMPHATIAGPCFIGEGTVIGNNALVRESSVGRHCVIGYGSEIARSIVSDHVWTHSTYLGDSVIGRNSAFGAGSVTANFRLDEGTISSTVSEEKINTNRTKLGAVVGDNCRIGVHVTLAPGVKIGEGSFVASAVMVSEDVPAHSYVSMKKGEMIVRENRDAPPEEKKRKN